MTRWERIRAVLAGQQPDRPPVAAWRHFPGQEHRPEDQVAAHLAFQAEYDWDLVKLQPSAVHFAEAWGAEYDYTRYQGNRPELVRPAVAGPAELGRIAPVPGDAGPFGEQLQVIRDLRRAWGDGVPLVQTVFSPLTVVELLLGRLSRTRAEGVLAEAIARCPDAVHHAAGAVAATLAGYCQQALAAGADGIFYAVTRLPGAHNLTRAEYTAFGRPYDLQVLTALGAGRLNVLHICGSGVYFDDLADYPAHAVSWASTQPGNPSLAQALGRTRAALMAGVSEQAELLTGPPAAIQAAVQAARAATGGQRLIVAPECSCNLATPPEHLRALRAAVEQG